MSRRKRKDLIRDFKYVNLLVCASRDLCTYLGVEGDDGFNYYTEFDHEDKRRSFSIFYSEIELRSEISPRISVELFQDVDGQKVSISRFMPLKRLEELITGRQSGYDFIYSSGRMLGDGVDFGHLSFLTERVDSLDPRLVCEAMLDIRSSNGNDIEGTVLYFYDEFSVLLSSREQSNPLLTAESQSSISITFLDTKTSNI